MPIYPLRQFRSRGVTPPDLTFPLSAGSRTLLAANGAPFPVLGRASWAIVGLPLSERNTYLADCVAKGFNAIEVGIPWRFTTTPLGPAINVPANGQGDFPFTKRLDGTTWTGALTYSNINNEAPDFTQPNEAYWTFVDTLIDDCRSRGLLICMFPSYTGWSSNQTDGWMPEMGANGATKMQTYGTWVATRYLNRKNIIWCVAGDYGSGGNPFTGSDQTYAQALLTGLQSVNDGKLITAEAGSPCVATDLPGTMGTSITFNGAYVGWNTGNGPAVTQARRAFSGTPPGFMIEEPYDEEGPDGLNINPSSSQPVRRQLWWVWLSSIGGYISGNGYVWPFKAGVWQSHINTQCAQDLARLNAFIKSLTNWFQLVPSGLGSIGTLVTAGGSTVGSSDYVTAAATPDGSLLVAYRPPAHTGSFTIDMTKLRGTITARWFDPTAGYTAIGTFPNTGTQAFTPSGVNSEGTYTDWVLRLDA
jgi:hypothetical protein